MVKGKSTCKTLKAIRKQIADANNIQYEPRECHYDGPCLGTCPACEAEVSYLEDQLGLRRRLGRAVSLIGISAGLLSACTHQSAKVETNKPAQLDGELVAQEEAPEADSMVVGKVATPECEDPASFVNEQQSSKAASSPKASSVTEEEDEDDEVLVLGGVDMYEVQNMQPDTTKVFGDIAEQMPMFRGGDRELMEYLKSHVQYPKECAEKNIQGRVIVNFVVERDGSITQAKVIRGIHPLLDAEALRVVNGMPKWLPGRQAGMVVAVKYTIPVTFRLQ